MKSKQDILNNWKTWAVDFGTQQNWTDKYKGIVVAELAKEVDWMLRQKDADLLDFVTRRRQKYLNVMSEVGQIAGHDRIGAWRMALWDWCLS